MMQSTSRLATRYGPWAVVTGASDGIGRAIAVQLAGEGLNLVLVARRLDMLQALAADLTVRNGVAVKIVAADLGTEEGIQMVEDATAELDVGLLVAAAGFGTSGLFADGDLPSELNMLDVNVHAVLVQSHYFARRFVERGKGGMVLMSSLVALQGTPHSAHYAATKAYVHTLAEGLHLELKSKGVDVLASAPGPVHTGFAARAGMQMGKALTPETVARATLNALGRKMTVAPGWLSKVLHGSLFGLPRFLRARIMGKVMQGMVPPTYEKSENPRRGLA